MASRRTSILRWIQDTDDSIEHEFALVFPVISVSLAAPNDPSFENHYESRLSRYRYRTIKDPYRTFTRNDKILNHFPKVRRSPSPTYFHPRPV